jgi:hypothetical protein
MSRQQLKFSIDRKLQIIQERPTGKVLLNASQTQSVSQLFSQVEESVQ